jgi:tetratricopeptide (TPR) repeat protein
VLGYRRTEDWASSGDLWEATTRTSPNNGRAWMNAGLELYRKGNLKEARRRYEKSRELAPAYPYLYINLSVLENAEGHRKEALAYAQQAVRLGPSLAPSHYFLGFALEQDGNTKDALIEYRRALEIDPRHVPSFEGVARLESATAKNSWSEDEKDMIDGLRLLDKDGDPLRAVEKFRALLARNPDHYGATFQLARALDAAGRRDEARTLWEKMRKMAEDVDDAATKKLVLERLEAPKH